MQRVIQVGGLFLVFVSASCASKKEVNAKETVGSSSVVGAGGKTAGQSPPDQKLSGRCDNETLDLPITTWYLTPDKGELFYLMGEGANRLPIKVTKSEPTKLEFSYRITGTDEKFAASHAGTVSLLGTEKWQWEFDTLKGSICKPVPDEGPFYKNISALGVAAGKYVDSKKNIIVQVDGDFQKLILTTSDHETFVSYYRVRAKSDDGQLNLLIATKAPDDASDQIWIPATFTHAGDTLLFSYGGAENGSTALSYSLTPIK